MQARSPIPSPDAFGALIRQRRLELGWTQTQLAVASGHSLNTISNIENGVTSARLDVAVEIARALGAQLSLELLPTTRKSK
jgi:y4mF family transcriptional regulator